MFVITQEARDAQNAAAMKAAPMAAGDHACPGVPSAAAGVAAHADYSYPFDPFTAVSHPPAGLEAGGGGLISAEDFRRLYIAQGHAADSPANVPGRSQFTPAEALRQMWGAR